jgi:hypothetical protein
MKYVLYALFIWFLYQFIFKLVVPVYRTSRKIKQGFREMQEKMDAQYKPQQSPAQETTQPNSSAKAPAGDYIDFEEVK